MKKLPKLSLNLLNEQKLEEKQMIELIGGKSCYCSCYYKQYGGSLTVDNRDANYDKGLISKEGCNQMFKDDNPNYEAILFLYANESNPGYN